MTLKGIDVYGGSGWPYAAAVERAYRESDFVIVKATQNTGFVNRFCDPAIQRAKQDGKLFGFYHYAGGKDPVAEANFFHEKTKGYVRQGIPCLDWESYQNKAWGDTNWCRRFVDHYHSLTGVWCMVYVAASAFSQVRNCFPDCTLWIAGYPRSGYAGWEPGNYPYGRFTGNTPVEIWQYSGDVENVDRNIAYLDRAGWMRIATAGDAPAPAPAPAPQPAYEILAVDGACGPATVRRWQQVMGTPVDGVISGQVQPHGNWGRPALNSYRYGGEGSQLVRAVQRTLGLEQDGLMGPGTIRAIQAHLGVPQDGYFGPATVRALQTRLNENRF